MVNHVLTKFHSIFEFQFGAKSYLESNVYLDMLEDSRLQIMRLGESNARHFKGFDLQILGLR